MIDQDFIAAIIESPDDDVPRLMYADWLEEQGDPRGEFIRIQAELPRMSLGSTKEAMMAIEAGRGELASILYKIYNTDLIHRYHQMNLREQELLKQVARDGVKDRMRCLCWIWMGICEHLVPSNARWDDHVVFCRGFVDEIRCTQKDFICFAEPIAKTQPITKVVLTDKTCYQGTRLCYWTSSSCAIRNAGTPFNPKSVLDDRLFCLLGEIGASHSFYRPGDLVYYTDGPSAIRALDVACLSYLRDCRTASRPIS